MDDGAVSRRNSAAVGVFRTEFSDRDPKTNWPAVGKTRRLSGRMRLGIIGAFLASSVRQLQKTASSVRENAGRFDSRTANPEIQKIEKSVRQIAAVTCRQPIADSRQPVL